MPGRRPHKRIPLRQEQASPFPPDSCEPCRRAPRNYLAPSRDRSESASSTLSEQETTWCTPHSHRQTATGEQFIPALPEHHCAISLPIRLSCRFHDLGSSSARYARFVLFDQVTFLQVLEKFAHVVL